ncbi:MAG: hypothetical protein ABL984_00445 [Pyrinomonadaceae bacterium]
MWIITNRGLLSAVEDRGDRATIIVRARQDGLLETLLNEAELEAEVWRDDTADYPNRVRLSRVDFADLLYSQVLKIDYPNFKDSVKDPKLKGLLSRVWGILADLGMGRFYGIGPRRRRSYLEHPELDSFFASYPPEAFNEDGSLDPDYITGNDYDKKEERKTL